MAKRTPPEAEEYRPVNEQLARSVLTHRAHSIAQDVGPSKQDEAPEPERSAPDEPSPDGREAKPQTTPSLKVVRPKRSRSSKASEPSKEPVRAKRKEMTIERRFVLSEDENLFFEELLNGISRELKSKVNASNVLRACLTLLTHVQEELLKQCRRMEKPRRPRNDDPTSIQVYEELLARLFDSAVRNTKSLD